MDYYESELEARSIDAHIRRLRMKLGPARHHVESVVGRGYRFVKEPRPGDLRLCSPDASQGHRAQAEKGDYARPRSWPRGVCGGARNARFRGVHDVLGVARRGGGRDPSIPSRERVRVPTEVAELLNACLEEIGKVWPNLRR